MAAPRLKSIITYIVFVIIGGGLFYLAFRQTEWSQLWDDVRKAKVQYLVLSAILGFYAYVARGIRWSMLLKSMKFPIKSNWSAIHSISLGYFSNMAIPRSGELFRCTALYRAEKIPVDRLVGTVILERIVDFFMLFIVFALGFITNVKHMKALLGDYAVLPDSFGLFEGVLLIVVILVLIGGAFLILRLLRNHPIMVKVRHFVVGVGEGVKSFKKLSIRQRWLFLSYTIQIWLMYFLMVYVVFFALESTSHLGVSDGLFIMVVGGLGMVIPSPGGIGSYHFLVMTGLVFLGVEAAIGMSFATIVHTTQLIMGIVAGLVGFLYLARLKHQK
ncbi:MAG: flippase-like domain-containing protein [Cryomorphaceae bacterium]|nr:flippase-like domain-containing protein [Cryomorphaceae bacterium]